VVGAVFVSFHVASHDVFYKSSFEERLNYVKLEVSGQNSLVQCNMSGESIS
jgi:hypothetical protein